MGTPLQVLGGTEAARLLGVSPVTISRWKAAGDMPAPDAELSSGPIWRRSTLTRWGHKQGRLTCTLCGHTVEPKERLDTTNGGYPLRWPAHFWCVADHAHEAARDAELEQGADPALLAYERPFNG